MNNMNFNNFLTTLTEEQRTALTACRTEEELEQVIDDYDIEIPDEMLVGVAGGKGIMPLLMAGIIAFSGAAMTAAPITAGAADYVSNSASPQTDAEIRMLSETEAKFQQCVADLEAQLQQLTQQADSKFLVNSGLLKDVKVVFYGIQIEMDKVATIKVENQSTMSVTPLDTSILPNIESAIRQANISKDLRFYYKEEIGNNGQKVTVKVNPKSLAELHDEIRDLNANSAKSIRDILIKAETNAKRQRMSNETIRELRGLADTYVGTVGGKTREFENNTVRRR